MLKQQTDRQTEISCVFQHVRVCVYVSMRRCMFMSLRVCITKEHDNLPESSHIIADRDIAATRAHAEGANFCHTL